jgi:hypothetical protein
MKRSRKILLGITLIAAIGLRPLHAQEEAGDDDPKINSNLGVVVGVPLADTAQAVNGGWGFTAGVGYNFNRRNAFVGEFMWNRLTPNTDQLQPLRAVLQGAGNLSATTDLFVLSANYKYELRGKVFGGYAIGGGGWYHRSSNLSRTVTSGTATTCTPVWLWWGFTCTSGTVTSSETLASSSASAWGVNLGVGFTVRVGEAPYRLYFESRYHYIPHNDINTQFVAVTVGIRY